MDIDLRRCYQGTYPWQRDGADSTADIVGDLLAVVRHEPTARRFHDLCPIRLGVVSMAASVRHTATPTNHLVAKIDSGIAQMGTWVQRDEGIFQDKGPPDTARKYTHSSWKAQLLACQQD